jgi:hypothetical protein
MAQQQSDPFLEFAKAFERWRWLLPPREDLRNSKGPTYQIDLDLDHEVSSLASVGGKALKGDTRPDWPKIVPEHLADLDKIERNIDEASISVERKRSYKDYVSQCRLVWEKIALLPVPPEGHLGFRKGVVSSFRFLEDTYGFRLTQCTPIKVRYESPELFLELNHSPQAPELSLELGDLRHEAEQHSFSLDDILHWAGLGLRFDYARFDLERRDDVASFLEAVAQLLRDCANSLLRNDRSSFDTLLLKQGERERLIEDEAESS